MEPGVVCFYIRGQKCVGGILALINDAFLITFNYQHENTASVYE